MTPPSPPRRAVLAICVCIFALGQFHRASGSVTTPLLVENLMISATAVSTIVAVMFIATVIGQLPLGAALDWIGARRMLVATTLVVSVGTGLFAMAGDYTQFLLARVLIGLGLAVSGAAIHVIIARAFPRRDFAYAQGLIVSIGGFGGLFGTYPLAVALERVPWPYVFATLAILTALLAISIFRYLPPPAPRSIESVPVSGYVGMLRMPEMQKVLCLGFVVWAPIVVITGLWGSAYFQDIHGLSPEAAGALLFGFYSATIVGAYVFGWLDRRLDRRKGLILGAAAGSGGLYLILAALPTPSAVLATALLVTMIFLQQFHVSLSAHLRGIIPAEMLGRASALYTLVAVTAIPTMQLGFGLIRDLAANAGLTEAQGYRLGFGGVGVLIILAATIYASAKEANIQ